MQNSVALGAFTGQISMTYHITPCVAELAWYSPSSTQWIYLCALEHVLGIYAFTSIYCTQINFAFTFRTTNVLAYSGRIMTHFELD